MSGFGKVLVTGGDRFIWSHLVEALVREGHDVRAFVQYNSLNTRGWLDLVDAALRYKLDVFADDIRHPDAASKIGVDQMALSFHRAFGTPVSVIQPFNTYGPRQSVRAVIPTVITQILAGAKEIKLGARHSTRDFTYTEGMVAAFVAMAKTDRALGEVVNVGSNFEISVGDVALMIAEIMDAKVEFVVDDQRLRPADSDVERLWADAGKAEKLLGWRPTPSGIEKTVTWLSDSRMAGMYKAGQHNI